MFCRLRSGTLFSVLFVAGLLSACAVERMSSPVLSGNVASRSSTGRSSTSSGDPTFLTASPTAPSIANPFISFWARKGTDRAVRMVYTSRPGHTDSTTFLFFRVRAQSLVARPDGTLLANGDSLLITLTLVDPVQLKVDFQPSGLRFSESHPATLKMSYAETSPPPPLGALQIWKQENPLAAWIPLASQVLSETNEVQADIKGFTGYAIAY